MNLETTTINIKNSERLAVILCSDFERLSKFDYYLTGGGNGSIRRTFGSGSSGMLMHVTLAADVMQKPLGRFDHKDLDTFNNVPSNLRECSSSQNMMNRDKFRKNSSSKYKGVSFYKSSGKWHAKITANKKVYHLGDYILETDAALAYNKAAIKYHGEFARLNKV